MQLPCVGCVSLSVCDVNAKAAAGKLLVVTAKSERTLRDFWQRYVDTKATLEAWHDEVLTASPTASICANNRVVFNICGNKYRLVVEVQYGAGIVWIKFIGTHSEYDLIDVKIIDDF